jgi:hypothetical protein
MHHIRPSGLRALITNPVIWHVWVKTPDQKFATSIIIEYKGKHSWD